MLSWSHVIRNTWTSFDIECNGNRTWVFIHILYILIISLVWIRKNCVKKCLQWTNLIFHLVSLMKKNLINFFFSLFSHFAAAAASDHKFTFISSVSMDITTTIKPGKCGDTSSSSKLSNYSLLISLTSWTAIILFRQQQRRVIR